MGKETQPTVKVVETINIDTVKVESLTVDAGELPKDGVEGNGVEPDYRLKILIVGLVSMLLECIRRIWPKEAPAMVLLFFCAYAWYMTILHSRNRSIDTSTKISKYFTLIIGGILTFLCSRLLFAEHGIMI